MKLHVLSDLHLEFQNFEPKEGDADVVILAGDIHVKHRGLDWARDAFADTPIVYVLGNHEYYGCAIPRHTEKLVSRANKSSVHVLENTSVIIKGVRFLGCTLWTDYRLYGDARIAGFACGERMNDFRKIRVSPSYRKFRGLDAADIHARSRRWLEQALRDTSLPTVVVTHHAPSARSLGDVSGDDLLDSAYASNLEQLVAQSGATAWIHGHIHRSADYQLGNTRVVCNPRGYPDEMNPDFDPAWSMEIDADA